MKKFTCVQDIGDLKIALAEAFEIKKDRFKYVELGRNKTLMMIFFNSSLREYPKGGTQFRDECYCSRH